MVSSKSGEDLFLSVCVVLLLREICFQVYGEETWSLSESMNKSMCMFRNMDIAIVLNRPSEENSNHISAGQIRLLYMFLTYCETSDSITFTGL